MDNDYSKAFKAIRDIDAQMKQLQSLIRKPVIEAMRPYHKMLDKISTSLSSPIIDEALKMTKKFESAISISNSLHNIDAISKVFSVAGVSPGLSKAIKNLNDFSALHNLGELSGSLESNDYVIIDEPAVKEFELPDTVAIPIGKNKIRMKTDIFISLLGLIISAIFTLFMFSLERLDTAEDIKSQEAYRENQLLKNQNLILYNLLSSVDTSASNQAKVIEDLKESVQAQNLQLSDLKESLDSCPQSTDKMNESANTESEN